MINLEMMREYVERAKWCLKETEDAFHMDNYSMTVRRGQEALELAVKAVLRYLCVEYPRDHDVSDALDEVKDKLPDYLKTKLSELKNALKKLSKDQGPAFYGFEKEGTPASSRFNRSYAEKVLNQVRELTSLCFKFLEISEREQGREL
jgi:HEPN domain-containing protein